MTKKSSEDPHALVECETGSVVQRGHLQFSATWDGVDLGPFISLGAALCAFAAAAAEYRGAVAYRIPREELWSALESEDISEMVPWSPAGWAHRSGDWVPSAFLREFNGPSGDFRKVASVGELGVSATVYEWEGHYLLEWSGPEGEGLEWELLGRIPEDEAVDKASDVALQLQADWNLRYDSLMGLGNLKVGDQFDFPPEAEPVLQVSSFLDHDGSAAANVTVYYYLDDDGPAYLIAEPESKDVVGRFASVDELKAAIVVESGFDYDIERLSWVDEPGNE